jgi:aminoglycoside/choline kinase family phosphotransferase
LISQNKKIRAYIAREYQWKDIGSPERYKQVVFQQMAPEAFKRAFSGWPDKKIFRTRLKGDGSDRTWHRLISGNRSLVLADHDIRKNPSTSEADSFVAIGRHLHDKDIPVPKIYLHDTFSGLVFMEDLGDVNLQTIVLNTQNPEQIISYYRSVIGLLGKLSARGAKGFDPVWTYQTSHYDQNLILEKECRYFVDAFLRTYMGMNISFKDLEDEFKTLAEKALEFSVNGFMHRDMQSRNIMIKNNCFYFIDFQGGRLGPLQYDLASLLIDPYVELSFWVRNQLLNYSVKKLPSLFNVDPDKFLAGYTYCSITRNLQILGAFAYLGRIKGKRYFEKYVPNAINTLTYTLSMLKTTEFPDIESIVNKIGGAT